MSISTPSPRIATPEAAEITVADLHERFGPIPVRRVRMDPAPGTATEDDVVAIADCERRLYELIDGILLEKTMGFMESMLTFRIALLIGNFIEARNLGISTVADGLMKLAPGIIRIPDIGFVSWARLNYQPPPDEAIAPFGPELAIEVLSRGNSKKEMADKLVEYFEAGARLVWYVDPRDRTVTVYEAADRPVVLRGDELVTGGDVLPGFAAPVSSFFAVPRPPEAPGTAKPE